MKNLLLPLLMVYLCASHGNSFAGTPIETTRTTHHPVSKAVENTAAIYQKFLHKHDDARSSVIREMGYRTDYWQSDSSWFQGDSGFYLYDNKANRTSETSVYYGSSTWTNQGRSLYTYDSRGNQLSSTEEDWVAPLDSFIGYGRNLYTYDANNNRISDTRQYWVPYLNSYRNYELTSYTYDAHNNMLSTLYQAWDTIVNRFINENLEAYIYDNHNNILQDQFQTWNGVYWDSTTQYLNTYDANNNLLSHITQNFSGGWQNYDMNTYEYNAGNVDTVATLLFWNSGAWENYRNNLHYRDSANNLIADISQAWNTGTLAWDSFAKTDNYYTPANLLELSVQETWDGTNSVWTNQTEIWNYYDANGNDTMTTHFTWNALLVYWNYADNNVYRFNSNNLLTYNLFQDYNSGIGQLVNTQQTFYYYMDVDTTANTSTGLINAKNDLSAEIFPNPSKGQNVTLGLNLEENSMAAIQIYDAAGRIISAESRQLTTGANSVTLHLNGLSSGNYYVQIIDTRTGKMSVLKAIKD
ncbi:MAG: fibronectin type domain protein [Bacteroidota bacterium]|nr:fibronectin type domain protein [Bacteroidota bacterium]